MSRLAGLVAAAVLIMLAGCSDGTPTPATTTTAPVTDGSAATPSAPATTATDPKSTSTALVPGAECLTGTWRLVRFIGLGEQSTYGTGQGGDVTVTFDDGVYTLVGKGKKPITVNLAGESARLRIDGTAKGTYAPDGREMAFTVDEATGKGTLESGDQRQTLPMDSIATVVAPRGKATLACPKEVLVIALPTVRLELER
ncbi:MAG TPA: hypothetical protein VGW74_00925 [Propionibacteriaceae bacterium]|nr:hypothetical protein [Propionibacteriaceae bacterium]